MGTGECACLYSWIWEYGQVSTLYVPSGASPALLACVAKQLFPVLGYIPGESPGAEQLPGAPLLSPFSFGFLSLGPSLWHMQLHSDIPSFITAPPPLLHHQKAHISTHINPKTDTNVLLFARTDRLHTLRISDMQKHAPSTYLNTVLW